MCKYLVLLCGAIFCVCSSAFGVGSTEILSSVSPKLREFLKETPTALTALTNCLAEAFTNRTIQLYYFYSDDETKARAWHYYPDESVVGILIRENQERVDEFICLLFEAISSTGQQRYLEVAAKVRAGEMTKEEFTLQMRRTQFIGLTRARDILRRMKLSKTQTEKSYYYQKFVDCPDDFSKLEDYNRKLSSSPRDEIAKLGATFDMLRPQSGVLSSVSPKLREFLKETPKPFTVLTNCLGEAFTNRTLQLYYFYSDDDRKERASHYYLDESVVGILVRENQEPVDEFICLLYEAVNSMGQKRFAEAVTKARSGEIGKREFTVEMMKTEFTAVIRIRDTLRGLNLSTKHTAKSYFYKKMIECPDDFEKMQAYKKKVSPHIDETADWSKKYDFLRSQSGRDQQ